MRKWQFVFRTFRILGLGILMMSFCLQLVGATSLRSNSELSQERFFSVKHVESVYDPRKIVRVADVPLIFKNGILFTYLSGQRDEKLYLAGSFLNQTLQLPLQEGGDGIYYVFVPLNLPAGTYTYRFLRNSIWINDPKQFYHERDELGKKISTFMLTQDIEYHETSPVRTEYNVFTFYLKDEGYKEVRWMGTANVWNSVRDKMVLKNGYWRIRKTLSPDEPYYVFLADGNMVIDPLNYKIAYTSFRQEVSVARTTTGYFLHEATP